MPVELDCDNLTILIYKFISMSVSISYIPTLFTYLVALHSFLILLLLRLVSLIIDN